MRPARPAVALLALTLALGACGGSDGDDPLGIGGDLDDDAAPLPVPPVPADEVTDLGDDEDDEVDDDACPLVDVASVQEAFTLVVEQADGDDQGCSFLLEDGSRLVVEQVVAEDDLEDLELEEFVAQRASARTTAGEDVVDVEAGDGGFVLRGEAYAEVVGDDALWSLEVAGGSLAPVVLRERSDGLLTVAVEAFGD